MTAVFYISAVVAILSTFMVITRRKVVHALLYLIVSLLSVALVFFTFGAPFVAALEVIVYAGAIMVLFIFVVMMLNLGPRATEQESQWLKPSMWIGPAILAIILIAELVYILTRGSNLPTGGEVVSPKQVGIALFGTGKSMVESGYLLGVELASILLLAGLVGAYHLGRRDKTEGGES